MVPEKGPARVRRAQTLAMKDQAKETIRGVGLNGRPSHVKTADKMVPSTMQILTYVLASGSWLDLGDEPGADQREQLISGQSNLGLMAALLVTMQVISSPLAQPIWALRRRRRFLH